MANSCVKCVLTSANAAENTVWISRSTALITRIRSRRVLRTSSSCSSRNVCRSCSSLNSSSASGLIGPSRRSSRSRSRTRAAGRRSFGEPRHRSAASAAAGSRSWSRRNASTAPSSRMRTSASSISTRRDRSRVSSSCLLGCDARRGGRRRAVGRCRAPLRSGGGGSRAARRGGASIT